MSWKHSRKFKKKTLKQKKHISKKFQGQRCKKIKLSLSGGFLESAAFF